MNKHIKLSSIILLSIMLFFINITHLFASSATVSVSSSTSKVVVGNTFSVTIRVSSSTYFGTVEFTPSYDKSKFKLISGNSSVLDYGKTKSRTYNYKFKAIGTGSGTITVKSVAVRDYSNEKEMSLNKGSKTVKVITQAQLEASYSKNNYLKSLKIDGLKLSPGFSKNTTTYKVTANSNTTKVNITARPEDSKSRVSGTGKHKVSEGDNKIKVVVTAQNGSTKTYTIIVSVIDPNPIEVDINSVKLTVVKRESSLDKPNDFDKTTVTINNQKIPAFYNEESNITLVGLKNNDGDVDLYIYDINNNTYTLFEDTKLDQLRLLPLTIDKTFDSKYNVTTIEIEDTFFEALELDNKDYYIIHAKNLDNGETNYYLYDKITNTAVRYFDDNKTIKDISNNNVKDKEIMQYKKMILLLGIETVIIIFVLICILISKVRKNKRRRKLIQQKMEERKKEEELKKIEEEKLKEEKIKEKKKTNSRKKEVMKNGKENKQKTKNTKGNN